MKKPLILIADDDRSFRSALRARLTNWGYSVIESSDGLGVIARSLRENPDAIILDHEMPNGDGCCIARFNRRERNVPIVFVSGRDREAFRATVYGMPDTYYLPKPLDSRKLESLLASTVARAPLSSVRK